MILQVDQAKWNKVQLTLEHIIVGRQLNYAKWSWKNDAEKLPKIRYTSKYKSSIARRFSSVKRHLKDKRFSTNDESLNYCGQLPINMPPYSSNIFSAWPTSTATPTAGSCLPWQWQDYPLPLLSNSAACPNRLVFCMSDPFHREVAFIGWICTGKLLYWLLTGWVWCI